MLLRLGTRGSPLARAQAAMAEAAILAAHPHARVETVVITTTGDRVQDRPLAEIGGKALWTKELDQALLDRRIDFAVHSMKDVETALNPGIALAAFLPRADPRDRLVGAPSIAALPHGARVGTSSPRRAAQLLHARPDCTVAPMRGNVATRLGKLGAGEADATFLAAAGLDRLGIETGVPLALDGWLPAPGQAAVGLATRGGGSTQALLAAIDHAPTATAVHAERAFLAALGGNCRTAVAAHAAPGTDAWHLRAELYEPEGAARVTAETRVPPASLNDAATAIAEELLSRATPAMRAALG